MATETKPYVVGIDIGGTNTVFGIVDASGKILATGKFETQKHQEFDNYLEELYAELSKLINEIGGIERIKGIGVGAPNANFYTGNIEYAPNLPWKGVIPFAKKLSEKFGIPVALTNDANAAAIGEMKYGVAKGKKDFIMITLGTGVGSGIVSGGNLILGHDGYAGELGHTVSVRNGRPCGCGGFGHLETYASAPGTVNTAIELLASRKYEKDDVNILGKISDRDKITSLDIDKAAKAGDKIALEVFDFTGKILGEAFADFVAFSRPEFFVLFGGPAKSFPFFAKSLYEHMNKNLMPVYRNKIEVLLSGLESSDAAVLGASALAWEAK